MKAFFRAVGVLQKAVMPIFLTPDYYFNCPLEASYLEAYRLTPAPFKVGLEP